MKKNNTQKKSDSDKPTKALPTKNFSMHEKFSNLYAISMFTLFPLFMTNMLFNIRKDKLHYFVASTFVYLFFILATYICFIDKDMWPKKLFKMSVEDWSMIAFLAVCGVSTVLSEYGMEAVTGSGGRDSGLLLMAMYVLCYFLVSRYFKCNQMVFNIFVGGACIVILIAILHEFYVDPFKILVDIREDQQETFISTIGNINLFSSFACVALPVMTALLVIAEDAATTVFYSISVGIGFMGILVSNSDSGYFGLAAFMAILFVYACGNAKRMSKYMLSVFIMFLSCKLLRLFALIFEDKMKPLDTIPNTLIFSKYTYVLICVSAILTIIFFIVNKKKGDTHSPKLVQITAAAFVSICALALLSVFVYFSFIDKTTDLGSLSKYLRLDDKWGTHRGYAWIRSIILFKDNGIKNMLVGSGPDTFGQIMKAAYREDMLKRHGSVFDSAHNEYLNYLVTIGILGLLAYVAAIVSIVVKGIRRTKNSENLIIIIAVIISYCAQAMFNLATPITTPYLFLFLGMGSAVIRRMDLEEQEKNSIDIQNNKSAKKA